MWTWNKLNTSCLPIYWKILGNMKSKLDRLFILFMSNYKTLLTAKKLTNRIAMRNMLICRICTIYIWKSEVVNFVVQNDKLLHQNNFIKYLHMIWLCCGLFWLLYMETLRNIVIMRLRRHWDCPRGRRSYVGISRTIEIIMDWCICLRLTVKHCYICIYRQTHGIKRTNSHLNGPRRVLQLSLPNPLKPCVQSRMM